MTEHEHLMYQVLGKISEANAPIVFKGALITKLVLAESGYKALDRLTRDIDANWVGAPPSMDTLVNTIQQSLGDMRGRFYAVAIREYEEKKSAGISIRAKGTDKEIMSMDISIKPVIGSRVYHYGEIAIKGVLADEILSDKITVLSQRLVFRRAKDLIDVYALAHCVEVRTADIFNVMKRKSAPVGEFTEFTTRRNDVEHAYNKLQGIEGKPPFDDVYRYLMEFVRPFAQKDKAPRIWNNGSRNWDAVSRMIEKPSLSDRLRAAAEMVREQQVSPPSKVKHKSDPER